MAIRYFAVNRGQLGQAVVADADPGKDITLSINLAKNVQKTDLMMAIEQFRELFLKDPKIPV